MALFSSANQAVETAVAIQRAIEEHNVSNPERSISVRMGLNSGDVTQEGGDDYGTAVHAAARVASKAQGGRSSSLRSSSTWPDHWARPGSSTVDSSG